LFCPSFVRKQQAQFRAATERASRIFVIGVRVNEEDAHIWSPLARSRAPLYYVGPEEKEVIAWSKRTRRRGVVHFSPSFEDAVPKILSMHGKR
jgi:hypothetical protein